MSIVAFEDDSNPFQTEDNDHTLATSHHGETSPGGNDLGFTSSDELEEDGFDGGGGAATSVSTLQQSQALAQQSQSHLQQRAPTLPPIAINLPLPNHHAQVNKTDFCCGRDQYLHSGDDAEIVIIDAVKTTENSSSPYIAYIIRTGNVDARRRYSEFESLRNGLSKLYPTLIIPPIPSKQTIGDYAVKQAKAKEDATMISRRKRMLQVFLNRIARHPILSNEHVFHRFLDRDVSWSEVLNSPPLSLLPKDLLKAPSHNPIESAQSSAYEALPSPAPTQPLRKPDQRFLDSEMFTNKYAAHLSGNMEKVTRRTMKRWSEYAHDHAELGAVINGFSLSQSGSLQPALEKTGQAIDATYISTTKLLQDLEQAWTEPLHEYTQFASIIKKLLVYRHQKHVQYEMTQETLSVKKAQLEDFEKSEAEAKRLEDALSSSRRMPRSGESEDGSDTTSPTSEEGPGTSSFASGGGASRSRPLRSASMEPPRTRRTSYGFLTALSYSLQGMMDVDPEASRRNNISKTRDSIGQLEDALHASAQDLKYASSTIQADLDRFQRMKVADTREMTIAMAKIHRDWCKQNLEVWMEAKKEIEKIEPHPNRPPADPATLSPGGDQKPLLRESNPNGIH
ncbi:Sorting nexin, cytoplasm-to-vacuole targeting pathway/endosomal sorting [Tulasnella sp. JGI-2019a]|nr:Sorting nexin, cytoplasm-to-vacuole targeting pathway/endosomal sorting [Tulasnella sp. JGI-2019a]KAG9018500.1 Sorting nexin, cytoplasm-to-vacuole targeting pathway/endosomal sorting [Tulasnella sp. JGI-2019a]KAG9037490.1 Sorting nexin, cytoplasm-to-vacuole targeting pathway/endosomal sorting [Tulasnella sp. JGI-2019a]